eukprot:scaffold16_cov147-Skeletonema_menzelii.AAC.14
MLTTSNATPNSNGGSRRNIRSVTSTPSTRSSNQFVTPTASITSSKSRYKGRVTASSEPSVPPTRRSKRGGDASAPAKLTVARHIFSSRNSTCFHFGLDPSIEAHNKVICSKCKDVLSYAPHNILTEGIKNKNRAARLKCERPWDSANEEHRETSKRQAYYDFHELFEDPASLAVPQDVDVNATNVDDTDTPPPPQKRRKQKKAANNQQHDAQSIIIGEDGHFTDEAVELFQTKLLRSTPNENDMKVADMLMQWNLPLLFDKDGHLSEYAVKMFERQLQASRKGGLSPNQNDMRVAGMLMKWTFESQNTKQYNAQVAVMPSFSRVKPMPHPEHSHYEFIAISACSELKAQRHDPPSASAAVAVRFNPPSDIAAHQMIMIRICPDLTATAATINRTPLHVAAGSKVSASGQSRRRYTLHAIAPASCELFEDQIDVDDEDDASTSNREPPNHKSIATLLSISLHAATLEGNEEMSSTLE